jgi:hypothetical protein
LEGKQSSNGLGVPEPSEVLAAWLRAGQFNGVLMIPGAPFVVPPQHFKVSSIAGVITIESHPADSWPQILIEFSPSQHTVPTVKRVLFRPSKDTADAEVLYTRLLYTVTETGSYFLASEVTSNDQLIGMSFNCQPFSEEQTSSLVYRAKIARKLRFIEQVFNIQESLPENITPTHVQYIEAIFRGLTEGEFTTRGDAVTVFLRTGDVALSEPPFSEAGPFEYSLGNEQALLFQLGGPYRTLDVGPYYLKLQRAVVANRKLLAPLREGQDSWVRFEVLDSQITYRYEKYVQPQRHNLLVQKLARFHSLLEAEEPVELAETLFEPLISAVLPAEALKICVGWLEYHDFPDRFSAQEPIRDASRSCWQVPIYIVYAGGRNAAVGELLIDLKTGSIIDEPSPEMMYQQGIALGEQLLRAG